MANRGLPAIFGTAPKAASRPAAKDYLPVTNVLVMVAGGRLRPTGGAIEDRQRGFARVVCLLGRKASRADLDPVEIPRLLPNLILFEAESGLNRLRARLTGTNIVAFYGRDYTGSYLDELELGDQRQSVLGDYRACLESSRPSLTARMFWNIHGLQFRFERLILPPSDDDRVVNMLLAGVDYHEVRDV